MPRRQHVTVCRLEAKVTGNITDTVAAASIESPNERVLVPTLRLPFILVPACDVADEAHADSDSEPVLINAPSGAHRAIRIKFFLTATDDSVGFCLERR